jgi:hypothetical protein
MVDPSGLENYVGQVRAGIHKEQILAELAQSPEGKLKSAEFAGLDSTIAKCRKGVPHFWTLVLRFFTHASSTERQLRVIDNHLYVVERDLARHSALLRELLTLVKRGSHKADTVDSILGATVAPQVADATVSAQLPPWISRTFSELKFTIATRLKD